jgi:hypothetical protein
MRLNIARVGLIALTMLVTTSVAASAQTSIFSVALSGGLAGSFDEDSGFSNATFQARFAFETAQHQFLSVRLGRMDFTGESLSLVNDATIDYVTVAGEYLFTEGNYESGFFMGLGLYDLTGSNNNLEAADEGTVGLLFGAVGEFDVAERWFIYGEAAFHYINLDVAQMFADIQVGLGFRF